MKIGLVLPCNIWFAPFVNIYTRALEELNIGYDIISWNRDGKDQNYGFQFEMPQQHVVKNRLTKFIPYIKFASFAKKIIKKNKYDRLIVLTPQCGIFMHRFLKKHYKNKYILDYRDLSIEQQRIFKRPFKNVLDNSFAIFVSSPGFIKCLPEGYKYNISHNFNINAVRAALNNEEIIPFNRDTLNILTIGGIRDYSSNIEVVKALANKKDISISFVGKGPASEPIKEFVKDNAINNVEVMGYYDKKDEASYVSKASLMNIFYPRRISHDTAISNRFYNALIFKKPMIVTSDTTQGDYVKKYNIGLSIDNCENLYERIYDFINNEDDKQFNERCNKLLKEFMADYEIFMSIIADFVH